MLTTTDEAVSSLNITRELQIAAPAATVWESILEELGPGFVMPDGTSLNMKLEAWPGGRWFRDLGNHTGHFWGHVQVIKPPALLELIGPMFMSYPAVSHIQYRLTAEGAGTRLKLTHRAMGHINPEHREGVSKGWGMGLQRIQETAEKRAARR